MPARGRPGDELWDRSLVDNKCFKSNVYIRSAY